MQSDDTDFLHRLESGELDPAKFDHRQHLRAAFLLLDQHDFITALYRMANAIRQLAGRAGAPDKFNVTMTCAYLSIVAARQANAGDCDFETFLAANMDLLTGDLLSQWYTSDELRSPLARHMFVMPTGRQNQ